MDLANLPPAQMVALAALALVALVVFFVVLKLLARAAKMIVTLGCGLLMLIVLVVGGYLIWRYMGG